MAGGRMKYRHLGRKSSHRQALLRNLVTSLFTHESITTTWPKAKEAQRLAEKLITLGKKNTEASRRRALSIFYVCDIYHSRFWHAKDISHGTMPRYFRRGHHFSIEI
jgi:ribosomal protein L17